MRAKTNTVSQCGIAYAIVGTNTLFLETGFRPTQQNPVGAGSLKSKERMVKAELKNTLRTWMQKTGATTITVRYTLIMVVVALSFDLTALKSFMLNWVMPLILPIR
jgi:hypothetical protein